MKKPFSLSPKKLIPQPLLWLIIHLTVPLLLLLSIFLLGPVRINTALFDMLPRPNQDRTVMEADAVLGDKNGRELIILAAAPDFNQAKEGAALLYAAFKDSPDFEQGTLYIDSSVMNEFNNYIYNYRFVIAGKETLEQLENGRAGEIAQDALASAFSAFNFVPLTHIEHDPFFLAEKRINEFVASSLLSGGSLSLKDDVLAAEKDGIWYVIFRLTLAPGTVSVSSDKNAVGKIYAAAEAVQDSQPDLKFYFSGIPFHSYESSSGAQKEISLICTVTLIIILLLFLFSFRSLLPALFSVLAAGFSLGLASTATLLIFREVHIITMVLSTTVIGTCVDYSVHFFVHWKGNPSLKDGVQIRSHILKSIIMCVISTEICFFTFLLAPFPILRQFAVFSMIGLFSSFLTFFCIYPKIKMPAQEKRYFKLFNDTLCIRLKKITVPTKVKTALVIGLALAALIVLLVNFSSVKIKNDLSSLYTMSASLMESEKKAAQVMNLGSPGWYFIVTGSNPQETLEHEEQLSARLNEEIIRGNLGSFMATSLFVPSVKTQQRTWQAMKALLPLAGSQFEFLGFPPEYADSFTAEFNAAAEQYCFPADAPLQAGVSNLWIGGHNGQWSSCVIPLHPGDGEALFRSIAAEFDFVYFINKAQDIGRDLDTLTKTMLLFFLIAYLIISVVICCVYSRRDSIRICAAPLFMVLITVTVLAVCKIPLGFFSAAALVLVFGLGLDYIFYMTGNKRGENAELTRLAVLLSFATTLLSFGALALSSFTPTHIFGLTVSAGLSGAFIFSMLLQNE